MRFLSVCSGIEAASQAWTPLGWKAVAFSEIEPFPCAVLAHHYPNVPNWGDMTKFQEWPDVSIDLLCGGTPCQSFSVAGLRKGLADPRGNLALTYLAIAARYRPQWLVWENVPGVFSSLSHDAPNPCAPPPPVDMERDGQELETDDEYCAEELHAFNCFLAGLSELGYGWAYRVLDAQYFGVPQRRRRPFVVGCLGSRQRAAAVLFERHGLSGHPAPRREAGPGTAVGALAGTSPGGGWRVGADEAAAGQLVPQAFGGNDTRGPIEVATARNACASASGRMDFESETFLVSHALTGEGFDASEDGTGRGTPLVPVDCHGVMPTMLTGANTEAGHNARSGHSKDAYIVPMAHALGVLAFDTYNQTCDTTTQTLCSRGDTPGGNAHLVPAIAFQDRARGDDGRGYDRPPPVSSEQIGTLETVKQWNVATAMQVRRLTPRECERLQGFEDDYTAIRYNGKPAADGPRYKALGNSWAVPCARWIGERIEQVEAIKDPA